MTVSYNGSFVRQIWRWRGSLWKSVWKQLLVFLIIYFTVSFFYREVMTQSQKRKFEKIAVYFEFATSNVPLTFILGFYVYEIFNRWWRQFCNISWPDRFMMRVRSYIRVRSEECRLINRSIARYCNLTSVLAWRLISLKILKRFPTTYHCVNAGLMTADEYKLYEELHAPNGKWFLPVMWISNIISDCQKQGIITDHQCVDLMQELEVFRVGFATLFCYNWIVCPLVYTQVVTIFVYFYFGLCIIGRQSLDPVQNLANNQIDIYFPIFTTMQFLVYMGWLNVGEQLADPFGEDDDDFELNYILDRNTQIGYMMADSIMYTVPKLVRDAHWDQVDIFLPHTKASFAIKDSPFDGHLNNFEMKKHQMEVEPEKNPLLYGDTLSEKS